MSFLNRGRFVIVLIIIGAMVALNIQKASASGQVPQVGKAHNPDTIIIHQICISGNSVTKKGIILRELEFKEHDTLPVTQFSQMLVSGKQNIFNTRLFRPSLNFYKKSH